MPPRGLRTRSRGGGRAQINNPSDPTNNVLDPILNQLADIPVDPLNSNPSSLDPSSLINESSTAAGGSKPSTAKFKPRMVKRVTKIEPDVEPDEPSGPGSFRGGSRGRGRGGTDRGGRGRPEIVMTASGAFAMGPAEASSRTGRMIQGPTRSGMRKVDNSIVPSDDRNRSGPTTRGNSLNTSWDGDPSNMLELYSDADDDGSDGGEGHMVDDVNRTRVADLNDITLEHSMAPLSLPWDPKRIADREKLIQERKEKMLRLANLKIKREAQEIDVKPFVDVNCATSKGSSLQSTRECTTTTDSSVQLRNDEKSDPDRDDVEKLEIKLKQEQLEELSKVGKQFLTRKKPVKTSNAGSDAVQTTSNRPQALPEQAPNSLYIFQFPRNFPKFRDPITNPPLQETTPADQKPVIPKKILKKKKPGLDDWMGWGKGGRRTECMGVPIGEEEQPPIQGQIGELVIRRSGRVQMIIADVAYDVLPGAQPTFHQEVAVIDPKPESNLRAMFVLGSTFDKFIVVPNVTSLLEREQALKQGS